MDPHKNLEILLVEDDEVDVLNVKRAFRKIGCSCGLHLASNGLEALTMLRAREPEQLPNVAWAVLLDLNMPRMNGFEFLEELRNDPKLSSLPVFVLTTSNRDTDISRAYSYNVAGYLLKPVAFEEFLHNMEALHNYLRILQFA